MGVGEGGRGGRMGLKKEGGEGEGVTQDECECTQGIDQLWRECLSHEYHYPSFWWSKLPAVIVHCILDNEANDIETH